MGMPLAFKDFDPRRSKQNTSFVSRVIWQNTGVACLIGVLVFPVVLGVAVGYLFVLLGVTAYRKVSGKHTRDDINKEAYHKIKVVLGEEVIDSSFPDSVQLNVQDGSVRQPPPDAPTKYYYHRLVNQNGSTNGYVKMYGQYESADSEEETNHAHAQTPGRESPDEASDSSTHASLEDNADKTDDEKRDNKRRERRRTSVQSNKSAIITNSPQKINLSGDKLVELEVDNEKLESQGGTLGRLRFALNYNSNKNELQVTILKAAALRITDNKEGVNSYVKICLLPQKFCWQRTQIIEEDTDPVFNETFVISGFSKERMREYTLRFCVVNYHDHFKEKYADDVIGDIHYPLSELKMQDNRSAVSITKWADLQPVICTKLESEDHGEVSVSLCFRPISGRLIVTISKIRGLPKSALDRTDPYMKISLYCDGVRLSKANTRVKRKTLNPVFNEKFNFNISADQISLTTVALKISNHHHDFSSNGHGGGSLGLVLLGFNSQGSGQDQWNSMLESPSRHIEKWHRIQSDYSS